MVKANELRVGNLFHPISKANGIHLPATAIIMSVVELCAFEVRAVLHNENPAQVEEWPSFRYHELSPIPLTPELLERAGFKKDRFGWVHIEHDRFSLYQKRDNPILAAWREHICGRPIQYLHQLQNLFFALCGQELELKEKEVGG